MSKTSSFRRSRQSGVQALDWLDRHPGGSNLLLTAHELLEMEATVAGTLPPGLARRVRAAHRDGPVLTLMVPGAAHAARLRQVLPATIDRLQAAGWPIERIVVRIDARGPLPVAEKPLREIQPLGPGALESFETLERAVTPGPLADAIRRLLDHHKG